MEIALSGEELEEALQRFGGQIDQEMIDILDERTMAARRQETSHIKAAKSLSSIQLGA